MCYSPIRIPNPSRFYKSNMPKYLFVPCGKCEDCIRNQQNEWFFRAYNEYMSFLNLGGVCYIPTLTYNNGHLPKVLLTDDENEIELPCFSHEHIRSFMRKLRIYLKRLGYPSEGIKYIICCEFGGKKGRPHYHCGIFFPYRFSPLDVVNDQIALKLFRRAWINGFVGVGRKGLRVVGIAGIRYAMKYVCKDMSFFRQKQIYVDGEQIKEFDFSKWIHETSKDALRYKKDLLKGSVPRHWQSLYFGATFLDKLQKEYDDSQLEQLLTDNKYRLLTSNDGEFAIPRYYHTKLERMTIESVDRICGTKKQYFTDLGRVVRFRTIMQGIERFEKDVKSWNKEYIKSCLPEKASDVFGNFEEFSQKYPQAVACYSEDRETLVESLPIYISKVNLHHFALYYKVLRFLPMSEDETKESKIDNIENIILEMVCPSSIDSVYFSLFDDLDDIELCSTPLKTHPYLLTEPCGVDCYDLQDLEALSLLVDKFLYYFGVVKQNKAFKKNKKKRDDKKRYEKKGVTYNEYESLKYE